MENVNSKVLCVPNTNSFTYLKRQYDAGLEVRGRALTRCRQTFP